MPKLKNENKYWEIEEGEIVEFGNHFMRCFDKSGKLQFGNKFRDPRSGKDVYAVKFVLDREALFADNDQAASYLRGTINDWEEMFEGDRDD